MMYTAPEGELGGTQSISAADARGLIAKQRAKVAIKKPTAAATNYSAGAGTPMGRAFKKFLK